MSYTGVIIDGVNTLEQWGLILLDDLNIGEAKLKSTYVDVPGTDGQLNLSYGMTDGNPTFQNRTISFTLFASGLRVENGNYVYGSPSDEEAVNLIRTQLQGAYHGREVRVILPDDPNWYFRGVLSVGDKVKFNSGRIPISLNVFPYRLKNTETEIQVTIPASGEITASFINAQRRVIPTFDTTAGVTIQKGSNSWSIQAGETRLSGLYFDAGTTNLKFIGASGTQVTVRYQEGRL